MPRARSIVRRCSPRASRASSDSRSPRSSAAPGCSRTTASARSSMKRSSPPAAGSLAGAFGIQDDLAIPYLVHMGTQAQKEKWLPRHGHRRDPRRPRDERARRRQRPARHQDDRQEGRRRVSRQRREDVHLQRQDGRCHRHLRQDRRGQQGRCLQPAAHRERHGRLRPRQEAPQDGLPRPRHRRAVVQRRVRTGREPDQRQRGSGLHPADDEPAARAPVDRHRGRGGRRGRAEAGRSRTRRTARPSASGSSTSRTPASSWPRSRPPSTLCGRTWTARCSPTRTASSRR